MFYITTRTRLPDALTREIISTPRAHKVFGGFQKRRQFSSDLEEVDPLEGILPGFSQINTLPNPGPSDPRRGGENDGGTSIRRSR